MSKIYHLSQEIISKISAGEVIERPAYAVKELVENAIDAHATVIEVHIEDSGLKKITVIDNGDGMSKEDVEICFLPHTTSKIKEDDELIGIKTLGFRGEALSSIAAISTIKIKSKTRDSVAGTQVTIHNGTTQKISSVGTPIGTTIIVDNLFSSVPVRKKFLKSLKTEFRYITEIITHFSLLRPEIHFVLTHNKKTIFDLPKKENIAERFNFLLGNNFLDNAIPLKYEDGYIQLSGFLGKPAIASKLGQKQYIFVNKRAVTDKLISLAVKESFNTLLPSASTPVFLLYITLPFEFVDVNVHPRKEQVSFVDQKILFDAIKIAVMQTLSENNITFSMARYKQEIGRNGETQTFAGQLIKSNVLPWNKNSISFTSKENKVLQIHNLYILLITKDSIILTDQHAAHERILYEQFTYTFSKQKRKKEIYNLPTSLQIHVSLSERQILQEYMQEFSKIGFTFENFSGNTFIIRCIPFIFKGRNIAKIIKDMLVDLSLFSQVKMIDNASQRMLAFLSCQAAVKRGDSLSEKECRAILQKLSKTKNSGTCPHGRPTQTQITIESLNKIFRR